MYVWAFMRALILPAARPRLTTPLITVWRGSVPLFYPVILLFLYSRSHPSLYPSLLPFLLTHPLPPPAYPQLSLFPLPLLSLPMFWSTQAPPVPLMFSGMYFIHMYISVVWVRLPP